MSAWRIFRLAVDGGGYVGRFGWRRGIRDLSEQGNSWFYKRNLSPMNVRKKPVCQTTAVCFGPIERVSEKPYLAAGNSSQLLDLNGDGQLDLVQFQGPSSGFISVHGRTLGTV